MSGRLLGGGVVVGGCRAGCRNQQIGRAHLASGRPLDSNCGFERGDGFAAPDTGRLGSTAADGVSKPLVVPFGTHPSIKLGLRHGQNVHQMHITGQGDCARWALAGFFPVRENVHMSHSERPKHYLRQWRKASGLSLQGVRDKAEALFEDRIVAEGEEVDLNKIGLSHSTLSRIESFKNPYNQRLLEVLAEVYGTDVPSLIMRNPEDPEGIWSIYDQIPAAQRPVALRMLSGLKTGTEG